jgi:hypothetical protein
VAEWLNAAVSKTVTSVIPASGVRIPPSPLIELVSVSARRPAGGLSASQLVSTLRLRRTACQLARFVAEAAHAKASAEKTPRKAQPRLEPNGSAG